MNKWHISNFTNNTQKNTAIQYFTVYTVSMNNKLSHKTVAVLVGIFILTAYGVLLAEFGIPAFAVMIADVISGLAVIGIAILMLPYFKSESRPVTGLYLVMRIVEGTIMVVAGIFWLFPSLQHLKDPMYNYIHIWSFILGAAFFYYLFLKTRLIPRFISIWGLIATSFLALTTVLGLFGVKSDILNAFLVLIITNEVFLAVWLMVKGFKIRQDEN